MFFLGRGLGEWRPQGGEKGISDAADWLVCLSTSPGASRVARCVSWTQDPFTPEFYLGRYGSRYLQRRLLEDRPANTRLSQKNHLQLR